ncbi:SMP-30/gluconolactonase/LRE family protein [Propionibacterium australiense]|uniref:Six-bladed beta-propeller, TolB-like n=1 Tax=Propionibacterium australiense TaxID=119981 RepID=A0A383S5D9_9ACTN|nr:SMP-30/gluconolactonase/LRE family protein [Propionibacterium australiense]RLP10025.1 SMP-30/gluconolactonase/LRE family protein [Propionibacterium australiense]SYZ32941.1 Six-bladed beta-propeller, TolB-like [Propionibacterium australiense]VEH92387.1 Lactonase drp35 [Propionibacterium australiense]
MNTTDGWGRARRHEPDYEFLDVPRGTLTEGPVWMPEIGELMWVDIVEKAVHRARLDGAGLRTWRMPGEVGFAVPSDDGNAIVGQPDGIHYLELATGRSRLLAGLPEVDPRIRVNDGKCDSSGRVWFGTMHRQETEPLGAVFKLTPDGVHPVLRGICTGNGMGWSPDGSRLYYTDSGVPRCLYAADFDIETGAVSNGEPFLPGEYPGNPDGMCVDAEGSLWCARWQGSAVIRISPRAVVTDVYHTPMFRPTSCCFAGPGLDELIITSADWGEDSGHQAGRLMRFRPGVCGRPEAPARMALVPAL